VRWEWLLDGLGVPWLNEEDADEEPEPAQEREVPNYIRAWRVHRGLTVAELAKKSRISAQTIKRSGDGRKGLLPESCWRRWPTPSIRPRDTSWTTTPATLTRRPSSRTVRAIPKERRRQALEILKDVSAV